MSYVTHQRCSKCDALYPPEEVILTCERCGGRIEIIYDYERIAEDVTKEGLERREPSVWRYRELLPIVNEENIVSLGAGGTHLQRCHKLAERLRVKGLYIKDETSNPSGSFKDRCATVSISKALEGKAKAVTIASSGNAAAAAAAHAAKAGIPCYVFVSSAIDMSKLVQIRMYGAKVMCVEGIVHDCTKMTIEASKRYGWVNVTTSSTFNPYTVQGPKTTAYEVSQQLGWETPAWMIIPVGSADNLSGHWLGFRDFREMGFIDEIPRLVGIQAAGCAPFVEAYREGKRPEEIEPWENIQTIASGLADAYPYDVEVAMSGVRESGGCAESVTDEEMLEALKLLGSDEGIFAEPSGAASVAGLRRLLDDGVIDHGDVVVCEVTGTGLKDPKSMAGIHGEPVRIRPSMEELDRVLREGLVF
ncbi:MAG: threonine synthase [Candidatus Geothermarchaeales archaeon]